VRSDPAAANAAMVRDLVSLGALRSARIEQAFRRVLRHRYIEGWYRLEAARLQAVWHRVDFDRENPDPEGLRTVYSDRSLVTRVDGYLPTASSSQPSVMSTMLELLAVEPGMRILEIGTGTGYNSALLAELVEDPARVFTIEVQEDVARSAREALAREGYAGIHVLQADAVQGAREGAPYARIEATVGCPDISPRWLEQLAPEGIMLLPLQHGHIHPLVRITADSKSIGWARGAAVEHSAFMSIQGEMASANPWQSYLIAGLPDKPAHQDPLPIPLPSLAAGQDPLVDVSYRALYFFLTLSSRELWRTNEGFGVADPSGSATALVTSSGLLSFHRDDGASHAAHLRKRLVALLRIWDDLGRPTPDAFDMTFVPKREIPSLNGHRGREWVIERPCYWQIVRIRETG
jgi:protein-L-isoaspartate(D-aspartate) O-methyltransferase